MFQNSCVNKIIFNFNKMLTSIRNFDTIIVDGLEFKTCMFELFEKAEFREDHKQAPGNEERCKMFRLCWAS